jgi:pilus assembly protein FimV
VTAIFARNGQGRLGAAVISLASLLLLLPAMQAVALTLGDLVVRSVPGEPLKATIPLTLLPDEALARIKVTLAPAEEYERQKLKRPAVLEGLRAVLLAKGENAGRIQLYGDKPWQGDEAILLLHLKWPAGELTQRYRIAPVDETAATPLYVEVAQDESLADIAIRLSKHSNRSYLHMMVALYRANPKAFYRDNLNHLKGGAKLRVPSDEELYQLSDAEVNATLRDHEQRFKAERKQNAVAEERNKELETELQQVTQKSADLEQRNRELKERLSRLEEQVNSMSQQVLEYAAQPDSKPAETPSEPEPVEEKRPDEGLSAWQMLLLLLLALGSVVILRRFAQRRSGKIG